MLQVDEEVLAIDQGSPSEEEEKQSSEEVSHQSLDSILC